MTQVKQGRIEMAAALFERYHAQIYGFYVKLTADPAASEDLTQTVFERLIRYRDSYKESLAFRSWIFQIARNAWKDSAPKGVPRGSPATEYGDVLVQEGNYKGYPCGGRRNDLKYETEEWPAPDAMRREEEIIRRETLENLHLALARLPESDREILLLTRFRDLKYAEVAEITGSTEGAVKVKAHRAIRMLRELFFRIDAR